MQKKQQKTTRSFRQWFPTIVVLFLSLFVMNTSWGQTLLQNFTTAGSHTYTVPAGVNAVTIHAIGGGGGGGRAIGAAAAKSAAGGGGGGAYDGISIAVSAGDVLTITVGGGGNEKQDGGASTVKLNGVEIIHANGGKGAPQANVASGAAGAGGARNAAHPLSIDGGVGATGSRGDSKAGGGGGAAGPRFYPGFSAHTGITGAAGYNNTRGGQGGYTGHYSGDDGDLYGNGGGGGYTSAAGFGSLGEGPGGKGARGRVWIESAPVYTISFNLNGGTGATPVSGLIANGQEYAAVCGTSNWSPTRAGYIFKGWCLGSASGAGMFIGPHSHSNITANTVAYAIWQKETHLEDVTVCSSSSVDLHAPDGYASYHWSPATGLDNPDIQNPTVTGLAPGSNRTYTCTYTTNNFYNSDFNKGNQGFYSDYGYAAPVASALVPEHLYTVVSNPKSVHSSFAVLASYEHDAGNMMVVNGGDKYDDIVWEQAVKVIPNTNYTISCRIAKVTPNYPASLRYFINGELVGSESALPGHEVVDYTWTEFTTTWNSGSAEYATVQIKNYQTKAGGNDFAIDHVVFTTGESISESMTVYVNDAFTAGAVGTSTRSFCQGALPLESVVLSSVTDASACDGSITYQWQVSVNGAAWTAAAGTNNQASYTVADSYYATAGNYQFRRVAKDASSSWTAATGAHTLNVLAMPVLADDVFARSASQTSLSLDVLQNDNVPATYTVTYTTPANGSVTWNTTTKKFDYTTTSAADDNFSYTISNGSCSASANVTISVTDVDLACAAATAGCYTFPNASFTGVARCIQVSFNDDPDGCSISLPTVPAGWVAEPTVDPSTANNIAWKVTLPATATAAEIQDFVRGVSFCVPAGSIKDVSFMFDAAEAPADIYYFAGNQHYYQYVEFADLSNSSETNPDYGTTWIDCYNRAKGMTYLGRQGYLATLTSLEEDKFVTRFIQAPAWCGGTRLPATGGEGTQYYTNFNVASETSPASTDKWFWACGPEKGNVLLNAIKPPFTAGSSESVETKTNWYLNQRDASDNPIYSNWVIGEPNNSGNSESCLTILFRDASDYTGHVRHTLHFAWNDQTHTYNYINHPTEYSPKGYLVEYGDQIIGNSTPDVFENALQVNAKVGTVNTGVLSGAKTINVGEATDLIVATTAAEGTEPLAYQWKCNGELISGANNATYNPSAYNATPGVYTFTREVKDACSSTFTPTTGNYVLTVLTTLSDITFTGDEFCAGGTATLTANVTAGTGTVSYQWLTGATTQSITVAAAGDYPVTVTLTNGSSVQTKTGVAHVTENALPTLTVTTVQESCDGNDGSATVAATGAAPFTYAWSNGMAAATASNLTSTVGTYNVTVTDSKGCKATETATITLNNVLNMNPIVIPSVCSGYEFSYTPTDGADGSVPAGTTFSWPAPDAVAGISGFEAGTNQSSIHGVLVNSTASPITVSYNVTPALGICLGNPSPATVEIQAGINPTVLVNIEDATVCSNNGDLTLNASFTNVNSIHSVVWKFEGAEVKNTANIPVATTTDSYTVPAATLAADCKAEYTFRVEYADASGCTASDSRKVYVNSGTWTIDPATYPAGSATQQCAADVEAPTTGVPAAADIVDGCGSATTRTLLPRVENLDANNEGTIVYTYRYTACDGSYNDWTYTYTVADNEGPELQASATWPSDITGQDACKEGADLSGFPTDADVHDNLFTDCHNFTVTSTTTTTGDDAAWTATRTYTITDAKGNTTTKVMTISGGDKTAPEVTCPASTLTVPTNEGGEVASVTIANPVATDNCDGAVTYTYSYSPTTPAGASATSATGMYPIGTTTVTCTVADAAGNTSVCVIDVFVVDTVRPCIGCDPGSTDPTDPTQGVSCASIAAAIATTPISTDPGVATYTHTNNDWNVTAYDASGIASITYTLSGATTAVTGSNQTLNGQVFNIGTTTVEWRVEDNAGNVAKCSFDVTVLDDVPPCIGCDPSNPDPTDPTQGISCASIAADIEAAIAIDPYSIKTDPGVATYTHTNDDWNVTAYDASGIASITYTLSGATTAVTGSNETLNGQIFNVGTTTVTWTVEDNSGLTATCSFTITVWDKELPCLGCDPSATDPTDPTQGISCESIGDQVKGTDPDQPTYTHTGDDWNVTATDNVGVASITYTVSGATTSVTGSNETLNGQVFNVGTTTVTWTVTDVSGNSVTGSFNVTVVDNQAPNITCPADPTGITCIDLVPAACADYAAFTAAGGVATDNVGIVESTFRYTEVSDGNACPETITRTYFISDAAGNENYCEQVIVVNDDVKPTFTVPADVTLCRTATGAEDLSVALAGDVTDEADNCTPTADLDATYTTSLVSGTDASDKVYTRTWTLVDNCGNETTADQQITVRPSILTPGNYEMTCPADKEEVLLYNLCEMYVDIDVPTTVNNMIGMDVVVTNDAPAGYIFPQGTTIVTWTATDECGASISCTQTVVVNFPPCGTDPNSDVTDANGNVYSTVRIGCQCWLAENLRSTNYMQDGSPVAVANDYNDDPANAEIYGKLYSWYSANNVPEGDNTVAPTTTAGPTGDYVQGVCPQGWALPSDANFETLFGNVASMDKLKEADSPYWLPGKGGVAPTSGFDARGAGYYDASIGRYLNLLGETYFWTSEPTINEVKGHCAVINFHCPEGLNQSQDKGRGQSVRCLRME